LTNQSNNFTGLQDVNGDVRVRPGNNFLAGSTGGDEVYFWYEGTGDWARYLDYWGARIMTYWSNFNF